MEQEVVTSKRMSKGMKQKTAIFSCLFDLSKNSLALGAGIPIAFFLFLLMSKFSESLEGLKYFSMNILFDTNAIFNGDNV